MTEQLPPGTTGRREALDSLREQQGSTNAALWFERYYKIDQRAQSVAEAEHKRTLMVAVAGLAVPAIYQQYYDRWRAALPRDCLCAVAEVRGRMVIGTGDKGVAEAGMTLHHTYGVPYIPGSALKGLAAAYAHQRLADDGWRKPPLAFAEPRDLKKNPYSAHEILFGSTRSAGYLTFFDALYIPNSTPGNRPLAPDVITGHHSEYYVTGAKPPADWDSPIPVPFLTATGSYLIALAGPEQWGELALKIVGMALRDNGIGAKTAAGYGRMHLFTLDNVLLELPGAPHADDAGAEPPATTVPGDTPDIPVPPTQGGITGTASPGPAVTGTRSIPGAGAVFAGKVIERDATTVLISVPGHAPEAVVASLRVASDTPGWRPDDLARVEVIEREERAGRTILSVRRAPKAKKS